MCLGVYVFMLGVAAILSIGIDESEAARLYLFCVNP
jgi:hypothetical protein